VCDSAQRSRDGGWVRRVAGRARTHGARTAAGPPLGLGCLSLPGGLKPHRSAPTQRRRSRGRKRKQHIALALAAGTRCGGSVGAALRAGSTACSEQATEAPRRPDRPTQPATVCTATKYGSLRSLRSFSSQKLTSVGVRKEDARRFVAHEGAALANHLLLDAQNKV